MYKKLERSDLLFLSVYLGKRIFADKIFIEVHISLQQNHGKILPRISIFSIFNKI